VQLFPVLLLPIFLRSQPLQDEALSGRLRTMASESSLQLSGVYRLDLSTDTKAANAMLAGLGSTRRVYLADTLLESFTPGEIDVVFAHELGHHTRRHVWKLLVLSALLATVRVGVLMYFFHPLRGPEAPRWPEAVATLPTVIFWLVVLEFVLKPLRHAVSRRFERQCDRDALRRTADADSYRSALTRLAEMNLADPVPHPVVEWYFYDHPAMCKRLALADTLTESQSQRGSTAT
jgi:STE24 endopeptidase